MERPGQTMKIVASSREGSDKEQAGHVRDREIHSRSENERAIGRLFQAYFNNKMTLLIFLIQSKNLKPNLGLVEGVFRFLDDLYRHMLTGNAQEQYRHAFEWLKFFFRTLPDVSLEQRDRAKEFIRGLYHAMGMSLKADI